MWTVIRLWQHELEQDCEGSIEKIVSAVKKQPQDNGNKRAAYSKEIAAALGRLLESEFGRGFGEKNLHRMVQFAEIFSDEKIVSALRSQLGWAHFKSLISIEESLKRKFYAEICRVKGTRLPLEEAVRS